MKVCCISSSIFFLFNTSHAPILVLVSLYHRNLHLAVEKSRLNPHRHKGTSAATTYAPDSNQPVLELNFYSFEEFWKDRCSYKSNLITVLLYFGTSCLLVTLGLMVWIKFNFEFNNSTAAWVFGGFIIATLIICLVIVSEDLASTEVLNAVKTAKPNKEDSVKERSRRL